MIRFIRNHPLGVLLVLIWLGMMGRLVQKHTWGTGVSSLLAGTPLAVKVYDEWMGIYYKDSKVGYAHRAFGADVDDYTFREQSFLEVRAQGFPMTVSIKTRGIIGPDLGLKSFVFDLQSGLVETRVTGRVEGTSLKLDLMTAGIDSSQTMTLDKVPTLPGSLSALLRKKPLKAGEKFSLPVMDPSTLSVRDMVVEVKGEDFVEIDGEAIPSFRLTTGYAGINVDLWVDAGGRILKQNTPLGWEMIRETREDALTRGWKSGVKIDVVQATSIESLGKPIPNPRDTGFLSVQLPVDAVQGLELEGGRQRLNPGRYPLLYVNREEPDTFTPSALPASGSEMQPYLASDLFIQADHPEIAAQAKQIVGEEKNSQQAARLLMQWVHRNLEKRAVPSLPNALQVLRQKVGDCNEHTVLYVALARSIGLPARTNVGLVSVNDRFYYHAWPEVHVGSWLSLDPVFNQMPADATHIRLIRGGIDRQVEIVRFMGKIKTLKILAAK